MSILKSVALAMLGCALAMPAMAQSPNTAALVVVAVDQTGGVVSGAKVTVLNNATGAARETESGLDGTATVTALSLTGTYAVIVTKPGFTADEVQSLTLRAGETGTVRVTLVATGGMPAGF